MLEAHAHNQLKNLLRLSSCPWPHNLTLSRLVARSLRRGDTALIQLDLGSQDFWWLGLLTPLCLQPASAVLVLSETQRRRLLRVELPRLMVEGFNLACWEDLQPPPDGQIWLMNHSDLIHSFYQGALESKYVIVPEAELLSERLRDAMELEISHDDWEKLRRVHPSADLPLLQLYERLSRRLFAHSTRVDDQVRMDCSEIVSLRDLLGVLGPSPSPWSELIKFKNQNWASWAELDHKTLTWKWKLKPLEPFKELQTLFQEQPVLFLTGTGKNDFLLSQLKAVDCQLSVEVALGSPLLQEPIALFAPHSQPLPNTEFYSQHLLDQSRRLILGLSGITILLLDDSQLRLQLATELAAEFGQRVVCETTTPASNGVICCNWSWWRAHLDQLPAPEQLIVAMLPLASVEDPLIAARVEALKRQGRDWFRELLLPEALSFLPQAVAPLRANHGRIAILDGRLRSRSWGEQFCRVLEPWIPLHRLLPN